jgi:formylmethanofuran dehydrogenase subunit E
MDAEASQVFDIQAATVALPARREDQASVACQQCGEQVGP